MEDRKKKGYAIVAEILAILKDIPLGQHMMEIGLQLRQAMLLNGILYNSEAWHDISDDDIKVLESIDEHLLRSLVKAHSKTPLEFLYMETGSTPIRHIVSCRRLLYLQKILKRPEKELVRRILIAQSDNPTKSYFVKLVEKDLNQMEEDLDFNQIQSMSIRYFKKLI